MENSSLKHITKEAIITWLSSITNAENLFQSYFELNKKNIPLVEMYKTIDKNLSKSIGIEANTNLRSINQGYTQLKETSQFFETDWFYPFSDVSIHKHLRYFPIFWHEHAFFEMCYVISGKCTHVLRTLNKSIQLNLTTGDLLIIPPGIEHNITMNSNSIVVNILLRKSTFEKVFLNNLPSETILYNFFFNALYSTEAARYILCHSGQHSQLLDLFYNIAEIYCNNQLYANNIINQLLSIFFNIMLRDHSSNIEFAGDNSPCKELVPSILQYIESNYATTNVQDISEHFGFNPSYLSQMFKKNTGSTLINALIQTRIDKAKGLLIASSLPVELITDIVGYTDITYFIRIFKKITGLTPLQYRKQNNIN